MSLSIESKLCLKSRFMTVQIWYNLISWWTAYVWTSICKENLKSEVERDNYIDHPNAVSLCNL